MDNKIQREWCSFPEYTSAIKNLYKDVLGFCPTSVEAPWILYYENDLGIEAAAYKALVDSGSSHLLKLWDKAYSINETT